MVLLVRMLKVDLEERISVDDALELPWFNNVSYRSFSQVELPSPVTPVINSPQPLRFRHLGLPSFGAFLPSISPAASPGATPAWPPGSPCM